MAGGLAKLQLTLEIDGDKAVVTGLNNVEQATGRMANEAQTAGGRMSSSFQEMAAAFTVGNLIAKGVEMIIQSLGRLKDSLIEMTLMAARAETLGVAMRVVGNNAGYSGKEMDEVEKQIRKMGIATIEARESLTKMAGAQMDLSKSAGLARIAQDAAVIGGINSSDAFSRMIQGIRSGEVEILKTIGINVQFEQSYKKLAEQLGKKRDALSETEKVQARTNAVMEYGINISGAYEAAMGTTGKQLTSLKRYYDDLKIAAGEAFSPLLGVAVDALTSALKSLGSWMERNKGAFKEFADNLASMGRAVLHPIDSTFNAIFGAFNVSDETSAEAQAGYAESDRRYKEMLAKKAEQTRLDAAAEARVAAEKAAEAKRRQDLAAAADKAEKKRQVAEALATEREMLHALAQARTDYNRDMLKEAHDTEKQMQDAFKETQQAYLQYLKDMAAADRLSIQNKLALIDTEEKFYALTAGEAAAKRIDLLQQSLALEEAAYKAANGDRLLQEQLLGKINQTNAALLDQKKTLADSTALGGALSALQEYSRMAADIGAQTKGIVTDFLTGMENALVSFVRQGKLSFTSLMNSMLDDIARIAVKQGVMGPLSGMLTGLLGTGTAAASGYLPQMGAGVNSAGTLLDGTSAGGLSSLVSAVSLGAKTGTAAGASTGVASGFATIAPYLGVAIGGYMLASDMFKPGGVWNQSTGGQRAMRAVAYSNPVTLPFALLDQFTGGGLFGTKWKTDASGLSLGIDNGDLSAFNYADRSKKKSFFGGTKRSTDYSAVDPLMQQYLESSYSDVLDSIRVKSATLGNRISEEAVKGFTSATVKINLAGLDGEAQQKALADYFRGVSNEALALLVPDLDIRLGEDATAAYARLNALKLTNNGLLMKELELLGQGSGAKYKELLNTQREAELLGVDASTQAIQRRIWALEDEQKITEETNATRLASLSAELSVAQRAADLWRSAAQTLDSTFTSVGMAGLSPEAQLAALRGQFAGAVGRFQSGDATAAGSVSSLAQSLQAASRDYYASGSGFASDSAALQDTLSSLSLFANTQASGADLQVTALNAQIDQMKNMNLTLNKIASSLDTIESKTSLADSAPLSAAA